MRRRCDGFSLVELIVVISVIGILAGMVSLFIRNPVEGYMAAARPLTLVSIITGRTGACTTV